ncbi:MAG TPA: pyridoxamine 5'-phosphate oxidase family protein [Acidimicrobiales bacterium]|nr:pyridoxamine 5'-phosphate oxidase family protein [Acidimicrobiales bacterium]
MAEPTAPSDRARVRRRAQRADYDRATIHAIIDEALICHVGFVVDGAPRVIPTIHARIDDTVYLHGSVASRMLRTLREGVPACLTVTILDGLVLARSAFHHSMNYRSVVVHGVAREVVDRDEKLRALEAVTNHVVPGRWDVARRPNATEVTTTLVLAMPIDEASAKVRTGPPIDDPEDMGLDVWAGVVPVSSVRGEPIPDV